MSATVASKYERGLFHRFRDLAMASSTPKSPAADLLSLAGNPKALNAAIEAERRTKTPPGWLGLTVLPRADWQMSLALGGSLGNVRQVDVHPQSAPYRHGMRTGDYVRGLKINGVEIPVEDFNALALPPPVDTEVIIEFHRPGTGRASDWSFIVVKLTKPPHMRTVHEWQKRPAIPSGRRVERNDRRKFILEMSSRRDFSSSMIRALNVLAFRFDNDANPGFYPSYAKMAAHFGCSPRNARRLIARLKWAGVVKLVERGGPKANPNTKLKTNLYTLTWPGRSPASAPRIYRL
jgi:hypothetical protein